MRKDIRGQEREEQEGLEGKIERGGAGEREGQIII